MFRTISPSILSTCPLTHWKISNSHF